MEREASDCQVRSQYGQVGDGSDEHVAAGQIQNGLDISTDGDTRHTLT